MNSKERAGKAGEEALPAQPAFLQTVRRLRAGTAAVKFGLSSSFQV